MQYTTLGNTGLIVSRMALGAMTFTAGDRSLGTVFKTESADANTLVSRALDAGINFFDTADGYASGQSETLLGQALKPHRDKIILATKVGFRTGPPITQAGLSRRHIFWSIDQSLKRLGTDWIDIYIAHKEDPFTALEETLAAFDAVVRSGKVRYLGFSNWSAWKVAAALEMQKANHWQSFTHGQMYYSLLGRDVERDIIPMMQRYNLGLTVWSPLASGFLSGKYTRDNLSDPANRFSGFDLLPFDKEHGFSLIEKIRPIAKSHNATVAQIALAWLLAKQAVTSIILGASKPHQLEDNLGAADLVLEKSEIATLDTATQLAPVYPNWFIDKLIDQQAANAIHRR